MSAKITYLSRLSKQFRQFLGRFPFTGTGIEEVGCFATVGRGLLAGNSRALTERERIGTSSTHGEFRTQSGATLVRAMALARVASDEPSVPGLLRRASFRALTVKKGCQVEDLAGATGLDSAACCVTGRRSNQLD